MWLIDWYQNWQMKSRIARLSEAERQEILDKSPYEACPFQGEGYHVFRKDNPDYHTGYVGTIGEVSPRDAEDWLIRKHFEENDE